jgi:chromosome segregation ATPase
MQDHIEYKELTPDEIMEAMGLKRRAVYQHIDKNKWEKKTGFQGRVTYMVPSAYIAEYVANTKQHKGNANEPQLQLQMQNNVPAEQMQSSAMHSQWNAFSVELLEIMKQFSESNTNTQDFIRKQNELVDKILDAERRAMDEERKRILAEAEIEKSAHKLEAEISKKEAELSKKNAELADKDSQLVTLNRERESYNTSLVRAKDDRADNERLRADLEAYRRENETLKAELEKAKTPWWKKLSQ